MGRKVIVTVPDKPSRRAALRLTVAVCALAIVATVATRLPIYHQRPFDIWTSSWSATSVEAKQAVVRKFDAAADALPKTQMLTTHEEMFEWAVEILPYMSYEGLNANRTGGAVVPDGLGLFFRMDSRAFHLAGQAACRDIVGNEANQGIVLSGRYTNPVSQWYGRETSLGVLIHEIVHIQHGPFCSGASEDLEANTQIATMEVLSAMVNHGNTKALRPLLLEIRQMGLSSLQYEMPRDDYRAFLASITDDPFEIARQEKAWRFWGDSPELPEILRKYNLVPFEALIEAASDGTVERVQVESPYQCCGPLQHEALQANDWVYFLAHMNEYVATAKV